MNKVVGLTYELSVLAKAVQHKNLSTAANHVGLSQPQLSRMVQRLEQEFKVVLLDRSSRRKSGWTTMATDLASAFLRSMGRFEADILAITKDQDVTELRIGSLEGLAEISFNLSRKIFIELKIKKIELDVFDFKDLDSQFLSSQLDLIFTVRLPSHQKFQKCLEIGYQQLDTINHDKDFLVVSPFEMAQKEDREIKQYKHIFSSNSLALRSRWLKDFGGSGVIPVDAKSGRGKGHYSIYLLGNDLMPPTLWEKLAQLTQ